MVRKATIDDIETIIELSKNIFTSCDHDELYRDYKHIFENSNRSQFFLKEVDNKEIGFSLCQLRYDYVEGCKSNPVGYLEGIYVDENYRHKGYAKELLDACISFAKASGCTEFASDCDIDNDASYNFHLANGFIEANRIICFQKKI